MPIGLVEKILRLPDHYPAIFGRTSLSSPLSLVFFIVFAILVFSVLTFPELIWDEQINTQDYERHLSEVVDKYSKTSPTEEIVDEEVMKTWFSPRMWDYRKLVYRVHVSDKKESQTIEVQLAEWQKKKFQSNPGKMYLHYLYNPGFFWDVGVLLPISLSTLFLALYTLIGYLSKFRVETQDGRQPYIPITVARTLLHSLFNPWVLGICLVGGVLVTAGNHGTGISENVAENSDGLVLAYQIFLLIGYFAIIPFGLIIIRCCKGIFEVSETEIPVPWVAPNSKTLLDSPKNWLRYIYWITACCGAAALVSILSTNYGWVEQITNIELTPFKPIQRIIKTFTYTFGILSAIWVASMVIGRARSSLAIDAMARGKKEDIEYRIGVFDDLVLNEIQILEYFGIFTTFTFLSYAQSALYLWQDADSRTVLGIIILAGLLFICLVLLILPIIYVWYVIVDCRRFDRWVKQVVEIGKISDQEQQVLSRAQNGRWLHATKIIINRWRFTGPFFALFFALYFTDGLSGIM